MPAPRRSVRCSFCLHRHVSCRVCEDCSTHPEYLHCVRCCRLRKDDCDIPCEAFVHRERVCAKRDALKKASGRPDSENDSSDESSSDESSSSSSVSSSSSEEEKSAEEEGHLGENPASEEETPDRENPASEEENPDRENPAPEEENPDQGNASDLFPATPGVEFRPTSLQEEEDEEEEEEEEESVSTPTMPRPEPPIDSIPAPPEVRDIDDMPAKGNVILDTKGRKQLRIQKLAYGSRGGWKYLFAFKSPDGVVTTKNMSLAALGESKHKENLLHIARNLHVRALNDLPEKLRLPSWKNSYQSLEAENAILKVKHSKLEFQYATIDADRKRGRERIEHLDDELEDLRGELEDLRSENKKARKELEDGARVDPEEVERIRQALATERDEAKRDASVSKELTRAAEKDREAALGDLADGKNFLVNFERDLRAWGVTRARESANMVDDVKLVRDAGERIASYASSQTRGIVGLANRLVEERGSPVPASFESESMPLTDLSPTAFIFPGGPLANEDIFRTDMTETDQLARENEMLTKTAGAPFVATENGLDWAAMPTEPEVEVEAGTQN